MRIGPAAIVARINVAENITALWTFANALGLHTDVINERTADAGVTIEAVLFRDGFVLKNNAAIGTDAFIASRVLADAQDRFLQRIDGSQEWGDGINPRDTNLFRAAPGELATDNHFNIGGTLDLGADIELSERTTVLGAGVNHDVATGVVAVQRFSITATGNITGFAGGREGRLVIVINIGASTITLNNNNAGSLAANRMHLPNEADVILNFQDSATLWYDNATSRWRGVSVAV